MSSCQRPVGPEDPVQHWERFLTFHVRACLDVSQKTCKLTTQYIAIHHVWCAYIISGCIQQILTRLGHGPDCSYDRRKLVFKQVNNNMVVTDCVIAATHCHGIACFTLAPVVEDFCLQVSFKAQLSASPQVTER